MKCANKSTPLQEGVYQCPTKRCKNSVSVYRQVRRQNDEFHDVLRFEQPIPAHPSPKDKAFPKSDDIAYTSSGVASISVPVVWNGENRNPIGEKEYIGELKTTEGKTYTLVKQRYFTSVMCVKCKKDMHLWDELRKYDGEDELRWFLARKEGNSSKKDVEDGGSSDAETLVGL